MPGGAPVVTVLFLAGALAAGVSPVWVAVVALAVWRPWWFLLAAAAWGLAARARQPARPGPDTEAVYLAAVAAELRAGAALRRALIDATGRAPGLDLESVVRSADAGRPLDEVGILLGRALPANGRMAAAAVRIGGATGAAAAGAFAALAVRAGEAAEMARDRRVTTAQARLSAALVGLVPSGFAVLLFGTGVEDFTAAGTAGVALAAVGFVLEAAGLAAVWLMIRRAER